MLPNFLSFSKNMIFSKLYKIFYLSEYLILGKYAFMCRRIPQSKFGSASKKRCRRNPCIFSAYSVWL